MRLVFWTAWHRTQLSMNDESENDMKMAAAKSGSYPGIWVEVQKITGNADRHLNQAPPE